MHIGYFVCLDFSWCLWMTQLTFFCIPKAYCYEWATMHGSSRISKPGAPHLRPAHCEDPLQVNMEEIDLLCDDSPSKFSTEKSLAEYTLRVLDACPATAAAKLQSIFLQSCNDKHKFFMGTLCSGSDSVVDVLEALSFLKWV